MAAGNSAWINQTDAKTDFVNGIVSEGTTSEGGRVLVEDAKVQERWQGYFCKLFNGEDLDVSRHTEHLAQEEQEHYRLSQPITGEEVKEALRKMKNGKAVGPDNILVEVWKSLGEDGVAWLTDFFNVIFKTGRMP